MKAKLVPIFGIILVLVVTTVILLRRNDSSPPTREVAISNEAVSSETAATERITRYIPYSPEALTQAESEGTAILFFHAPWCPFCRAAEADILAHIDQIPSDITILKTDYDTERELKNTYGVTTQHTFVQVDDGGVEVKKWIGGETLAQILENVQ